MIAECRFYNIRSSFYTPGLIYTLGAKTTVFGEKNQTILYKLFENISFQIKKVKKNCSFFYPGFWNTEKKNSEKIVDLQFPIFLHFNTFST